MLGEPAATSQLSGIAVITAAQKPIRQVPHSRSKQRKQAAA